MNSPALPPPQMDADDSEELPLLPEVPSTQVVTQQSQAHVSQQQLFTVLASLLQLLKSKDEQLYRHSRRVQYLANCLSWSLQLPANEVITIGLAALLHDIGKIGIQDEVILKSSRLTPQEFEVVKAHPLYGAQILSRFHLLKRVIPFVYAHHERWDGTGYPTGLQGEAIPLGARIVAIADAFEVMTSSRSYQPLRTPQQALNELCICAGTQFDPLLVVHFYNCRQIQLLLSVNLREAEQEYPEDL